MRCFVITLKEATERQAHITQMMGERGLEFEFFDAVDGRGFDVPVHPGYDVTKRRLYFGRDMKGGEMGVLLSHKGIFEKMVADATPFALVLEDDAELYEDAPAVIKALEDGPQDFDLVRFLGSKKVAGLTQHVKRAVHGDYTLNRLMTTPGGAHAYVISLNGARKLLNALDTVYLPIDTLCGHVWKSGLNAFIIQPGLARQDAEQPQYIGDARFEKKLELSGWMKGLYPFSRAWYKLCEGLLKRATYAKNFIIDHL